MPFAETAERTHSFGFHSGYPLQKIELVRTLIEQYAAALARPGCAPRSAVVITLRAVPVGYNPIEAFKLAYFSVFYHIAKHDMRGIGALIEHYGKNFIRFCCDFV